MPPIGTETIGIMPDGEHRVTDNHTWSSVTHDTTNLFPHVRLVTMYRTCGTGRLLCTKSTFVNTFHCIGKQLQAVGTELAAPVMTSTVNFNHETNGSALPVQTLLYLSFIGRFINHGAYRLPYPFLQAPENVRPTVHNFVLTLCQRKGEGRGKIEGYKGIIPRIPRSLLRGGSRLPGNHLAHFDSDVVDELVIQEIEKV